MATAAPLDLVPPIDLTADERVLYDGDAFFRGLVELTLAERRERPEQLALARAASEQYGDDFERRLADLEAGRHPYQRSR